MKTDINNTINKILAFARDDLMLDALDDTYALNRIATLVGAKAPVLDVDADHENKTFAELLDELGCDDAVKTAVADVVLPPSHILSYYFNDKLGRKPKKAFDFLFDVCAQGGAAGGKPSYDCGAFVRYECEKTIGVSRSVLLNVLDDVKYTPINSGNRIARIDGDDIMSDDILRRESAFAENYGGVIAKRISSDGYYCCEATALDKAPVKEQLSSGAVKVSLLDYPVPALAFNGIAKNSVRAQAAEVLKAAAEQNIDCVAACSARDGLTVYIVFATEVVGEYLSADNALAACGVFCTTDFSPLVSVLEKGTALSTDLFAFKTIYNAVGGVKHGDKAQDALSDGLTNIFKGYLSAAASATADQVKAFVQKQ